MSTFEAKALFNYTSKTSTELDVKVNETLYVITKDLGNGFSKVRNSDEKEGMVPSNIYTMKRSKQDLNSDNTSIIDKKENVDNVSNIDKKENDDNVQFRENKENDDDDYNEVIKTNSVRESQRASLLLEETIKYGTIRIKNNNIGELNVNDKEIVSDFEARIEIEKEKSNEISQWKPLGEFQKCHIESYGVDSKGLQKFITYKLNSSFTNKTVTRNFKEFELFRLQLRDKFPCILIPSLPSRELMTNFKTKSVEEGQKQLELWLNYITDHPVLTYNKFTKSFFEEEFRKSIQNKRISDFKSREFYEKVDAPIIGIDWNIYSKRMENMSHFIENFDKYSCGLQEGFNRFHKEHIEQTCKTYEKFGNSINNFYTILNLNPDNEESDSKFANGIKDISVVFGKIGALFKEQARIDSILVEDPMAEIINVTKEIPSIMEISKCVIKTIPKNNESKFDSSTQKEIEQQIEVIARTVDAEFNYLKRRREQQIKSTMTQYLTNQINLFTQINTMLNDTLSHI